MTDVSRERTLTIWEGEWPVVKSAVRRTRVWIEGSWQQNWTENFSFIKHNAMWAASSTDQFLLKVSTSVSDVMKEQPWTVPAVGIGCASSLVSLKSLHWGVGRAVRNGIAFGIVATVALYPHDARRLLFEMQTPDVAALIAKKASEGSSRS